MATNDKFPDELSSAAADEPTIQTPPMILEVPTEDGKIAAISFHVELRCSLAVTEVVDRLD